MTRAFGNYRRLARGFLSCSSLWVSEANVLYVCGSGVLLPFTEQYHRFDLRRIHAIALVRTYTGLVLNIIFGVVALGSCGLGLFSIINAVTANGPEEVLWFVLGVPFSSLGLLALVLFVGNLALGPTCHLQIQTAARLQKIRAVRRLSVGRRVLAELAPVLALAQMTASAAAAPLGRAVPLPEPLAVEPTTG